MSAAPVGLIAKDPLGKARRILETDAAVAEVPPRPREERLRGRSVHVDVVVVGKDELRQAERVRWSRLLTDAKLAGGQLVEIVRRRRKRSRRLGVAGDNLQRLSGHIA